MTHTTPNQYGLLPPQDTQTEEMVIGCLLTVPEYTDLAQMHLRAEMFYRDDHRTIYSAIQSIALRSESVDMVTVTAQLRKMAKLEQVGGVYAISQLSGKFAPQKNFIEWCFILKELYSRREAIRIGTELMQAGYDDTADGLASFERLDDSHRKLSDLLFGATKTDTFQEVAVRAFNEMVERVQISRSGQMPGMTTGIKLMDRVLGGWQRGDLIVLAGRPGMGKTALGLHFAKTLAKVGLHVHIHSLEMTDVRLADRVIVGETGVNNYQYKMGQVTDESIESVRAYVRQGANLPLTIDPKSFVTVDYIVSNARMKARRNELDCLIVDYLHLIDITVAKNGTKDMAIGVVTRKLKSLALELKIPVILLSQLNRGVESRQDKRPMLSDLRESGNIEQDADVVLFCYRPAYYGIQEHSGKPTQGLMVVEVAKHRNGDANVDIEFVHNESLTNFDDEQPAQF